MSGRQADCTLIKGLGELSIAILKRNQEERSSQTSLKKMKLQFAILIIPLLVFSCAAIDKKEYQNYYSSLSDVNVQEVVDEQGTY